MRPRGTSRKSRRSSFPVRYLPIKWGRRLYLVPDAQMIDFCNSVNSGSEPRSNVHGLSYLRRNDYKINVKGSPSVPKHWRDYILTRPVHGKVLRLFGKYRMKVDLGFVDGIRVGMDLHVIHGGNEETIEVIRVGNSRCIGERSHHRMLRNENVIVGDTVSSRHDYLDEKH